MSDMKLADRFVRCRKWFIIALFVFQANSGSGQTENTPAADSSKPFRVRQHDDLLSLESQVRKAVQKAERATVSVQVGRGKNAGFAFGSGVIVSEDGYVLTAAHVSGRPNEIVIFRLADGTETQGVTLGLQKDLDMGLMKITDTSRKWPHLKRTRSADVEAGDWVIATGHPGGFDRDAPPLVRLGRVLKKTPKIMLTDCTLVGGDSGGPLVDLRGNVVGIHSRIGADLTTNLHVPIDRFAENWGRLANKEVWGLLVESRPWIGVEHDQARGNAGLRKVRRNSPAARAGLVAGDIIVSFDGEKVGSFSRLKQLVASQSPGEKVPVQYRRGNLVYETLIDIGAQQTRNDSQTRDDADLLKDWLEQLDLRGRGSRAVVGIGKNADQVKESFHDVLDSASRATVEVIDAGSVVAFGTIVDSDLIVTKSSMLSDREIRCRFRNSRSFVVEKVAQLKSHDLALLKSSRPLPDVKMRATTSTPRPGSLLASSGLNVWPLAVGVVSSVPTEIPSEGKLGVRMDENRPVVVNVVRGSGAERAGIRVGDVISMIGDIEIDSPDDVIAVIKKSYPGDILKVTVQRRGYARHYAVELFRYSEFDEALADFEDFIGGKRSERRTGFPRVIQHDTPIRPLHCGGPVVDVNGRFVGINIARAARTSSYLLPADEVKLALRKLKQLRSDELVTVDVNAVEKNR